MIDAAQSTLVGRTEAAKFLGVSPSTIRRWSNQGLIRVFVFPSGRKGYYLHDLEAFKEKRMYGPQA